MTWKAAAQVEPLNMPTGLKFVLVKYANHADNDGFDTWPSYERVAHFTGHNKKTIERIVTRLRDEGILVVQGAPYGGRGKRGRGIAYRIDFERAREVYGYWEERRTNTGFEFKLVPALVVVQNGVADDAEPGDIVVGETGDITSPVSGSETGDITSPVSESETGDITSQTDDISDLNRRHDSAATPQETAVSGDEPSKNLPESARAREAGGGDPEGPPPACAIWRDNRARLEVLDCWPLLERAIPMEDDGEVLTLAVEAPAVGFAILAWAAHEAERVVYSEGRGRRIACRVKRWVQPALIQRGVSAGVPDASAHRRDGELVTLEDPAWRAWSSKANELEQHECQVALAECLPDDVDAGTLVLLVGSTGIAGMLHEELGKRVSRVVGMPVRSRFLWCMDVLQKARSGARGRSVMAVE